MNDAKSIPVLQLKLSLRDSDPLIWRRIIVPTSTRLHGLHRMIQILMQWWDYHSGPPEDCGGIPGLENILKVCRNRKKREYSDILEWLGDDYDPERFDRRTINHFLVLASAWLGLI